MALAKRPSKNLKNKRNINPSINRDTEVVAEDIKEIADIQEDHAILIDELSRANEGSKFYGFKGTLALFEATFPNAEEDGFGVIDPANGNPQTIAKVINGVWTEPGLTSPIQRFNSKVNFPDPGLEDVWYIAKDSKIASLYYDGGYKDFGKDGNNGLSAYQLAVAFGFEGTEAEWLVSIQGKDNYQLWLDAGNVGTYQDFFEASRGPEGPEGPPGPPGDGADLSDYYNKPEVDAADSDLAVQIDAVEEDILNHESRIQDLEQAPPGTVSSIPNIEFVYLAESNTSQENADIINGAVQRAIPTKGEIIINQTPITLDFWPCRTITWDNRVNVKAAGTWGATKLGSTHAEPLIVSTRTSLIDSRGNLENIWLDGNGIGTIGIDSNTNIYFNYNKVDIRNFTQIGIKTVSHILGTFTQLKINNCSIGWHSREQDGITFGSAYAPQTGYMASNAVILRDCYFTSCSTFAIDKDKGSGIHLNNCNFEQNGTANNNATGVIKFTNMSPDGGISLVMNGCWLETNNGSHFQLSSNTLSKAVFQNTFSRYNPSGSSYFKASGNLLTIKVSNCEIDTNRSFGSFDLCKVLLDNTKIGPITLLNGATYLENIYSNIDEPLLVNTSRALTIEDKNKILHVTANVTLTYPPGGLPKMRFNINCTSTGQATITGQTADLDMTNKVVPANKGATFYLDPATGKLIAYGELIA